MMNPTGLHTSLQDDPDEATRFALARPSHKYSDLRPATNTASAGSLRPSFRRLRHDVGAGMAPAFQGANGTLIRLGLFGSIAAGGPLPHDCGMIVNNLANRLVSHRVATAICSGDQFGVSRASA